MTVQRKLRMKDVAQHAGVSTATVSAVLSGKDVHVRVSAETRARVLKVAQELSYRPHHSAQALRRKRTNVLGFYFGTDGVPTRTTFFSLLISGLQIGCGEWKQDLLVHGAFQGRTPEAILAELTDGRIDGLVLYASQHDALIEKLVGSDLPVICIADAVTDIPNVVVDDAGGMRLIVDHMRARGHRRFIYRDSIISLTSAERRKAAFLEEAQEHSLEYVTWANHDYQDAAQFLQELRETLPPDKRPTCAVCWNDLSAYFLMDACRRLGLCVPEDMAVSGFDGLPTLPGSMTELTTIQAPWEEVGRKAIDLLIQRLEGCPIPSETVLPTTLQVGNTA